MANTELDATLTIEIGGVTFTLTGHYFPAVGTTTPAGFIVDLEPVSFQDAQVLKSSLSDVLSEITTRFGLANDNSFHPLADITNVVNSVPGFNSIANSFTQASVRITILHIDTVHSAYTFGINLDFSANPVKLGVAPVQIAVSSFGLTITHPAPTDSTTAPAP
jgi:hypothetical protein